jgi:hypothetical protein
MQPPKTEFEVEFTVKTRLKGLEGHDRIESYTIDVNENGFSKAQEAAFEIMKQFKTFEQLVNTINIGILIKKPAELGSDPNHE